MKSSRSSRIMMARIGQPSIYAPGSFPKSLADVELLIHDMFHAQAGLTPEEKKLVAAKVCQLMTSCEARRKNEYEHVGWWGFTEADKHSDNYQKLFADGITRTLVTAKAESASTKTGVIFFCSCCSTWAILLYIQTEYSVVKKILAKLATTIQCVTSCLT